MPIARFCFLICFLHASLSAQPSRVNENDFPKDSVNKLHDKYVSSTLDPDLLIEEFINNSKKGSYHDALNILQLSLILEKKVKKPSSAVFELNVYVGEVIFSINKGYALEFFRKAAELIPQIDQLAPARIFHVYTNIAGIYQYLMEYDTSVYYYRQAINEAPLISSTAESSSYNNLGIFYYETGQSDSARIYFDKALNILGTIDVDYFMLSAIKDNIAQIDVDDKKYKEAISAFEFNDSVYLANKQPYHYVINKVRLLKAIEKQNKDDPRIEANIAALQNFIEQFRTRIDENSILEFYQFANDYYFNIKDRTNQEFFRKRNSQLKDELEKKKLDELNQLTQSLLSIQKEGLNSELRVNQLEVEKQKLKLRETRLIVLALILLFIVIILFLISYMHRRKIEHENARRSDAGQLKTKEMEARLLLQDLELKKRDLTNVVLHNTRVYDSNQKIIEQLNHISGQKNKDDSIRSLLTELQTQNQISDRTIGLQSNIDFVNEEFYKKLGFRFPNLTKSETELCGYIRINLPSKDISILKNVNATSVKRSKNRLRKKLGISPTDDLYKFIRGI